ncbi:MAG: hypothetical protein EAX96_14840 [Candidatus Lokiarchaeota archaeon]|nr:hypothetical protein [Candidatus Lokiarchaeota archaeon]
MLHYFEINTVGSNKKMLDRNENFIEFQKIKNEILKYIEVTNLPINSKLRIYELVKSLEIEFNKFL